MSAQKLKASQSRGIRGTEKRRRIAYESKALSELLCLSEAQLQSKVIEPLLRMLGFENVRDNSGPDEKGKDIVATKTSEFGRNKLYAIQIKKMQLSARVGSTNSLGALFLQLLQAQNEEVVDPITNVKRSPDACVFITPYPVAPSSWDKFHKLSMDLDRNNIEFIDGSKLIDLIQRHLPEVVLNQFSMEVQYRLELERGLNSIPESPMAFGLTSELELDSIYVDISLSNSFKQIDQLAAKPANLQGRTLLIMSTADIAHLRYLAAYWGAEPVITDPPECEKKEERKRLSNLQKQIKKGSKGRVIGLNLDPVIKAVQRKVRNSISELAKISSYSTESEINEIACSFADTQNNLSELFYFEPVWQHWLDFVKPKSKPEWKKPQVQLPANCLLGIKRNMYILGEPGSGKTTLLRRFAQMMARTSEATLPIYLPLIFVKEPSREALIYACIEQLEIRGYELGTKEKATKRFLSSTASGEFQLLLDGLDEVGTDSDELMSVIEKFALDFPKCLIMLSCRSAFEVPHFRGALELIVSPFTKAQLTSFIERWFTSQPSSLTEILTWMKLNPQMRTTARNPLVAALLCSLFHLGAEMPTTEVELYERRFELLLGKWEQAKGIRRLPGEIRRRYWRFITDLAFDMHGRESRVLPMSNVCRVAEHYFSPEYHKDPASLVMDCVHRGVLEFEAAGGLSFGHLTYQEYLAARYLALESDIEFIFQKLRIPWWRNTMRFYAAYKEDITSLVKYLINKKEEQVSRHAAEHVLEMVKLAPWTEEGAIKELDRSIDFLLDDDEYLAGSPVEPSPWTGESVFEEQNKIEDERTIEKLKEIAEMSSHDDLYKDIDASEDY